MLLASDMVAINLLSKGTAFGTAKPRSPAVADDLRWGTWSPQALVVGYAGNASIGIGPGEHRVIAEPTAPTFGGIVQKSSTHYDVQMEDGRTYEVKSLAGSDHEINITGEGNEKVTRFVSDIGKVVEQLDAFKGELERLSQREIVFLKFNGFDFFRFMDFYNTVVPKLRTGTEISRGTVEHSMIVFDEIANAVVSYTVCETGRALVEFRGKIFDITNISADVLVPLMKSIGIDPGDESWTPGFTSAVRKLTHPWVTQAGRFQSDWRSLAKASEVVGEATAGLVIVHAQYGWFLVPPEKLDDVVKLNGITRRMLRFKMTRMPPKPVPTKVEEKEWVPGTSPEQGTVSLSC